MAENWYESVGQHLPRVEITKGSHSGTVGLRLPSGDVWTPGVGVTGCVSDRTCRPVSSDIPFADDGKRVPDSQVDKYLRSGPGNTNVGGVEGNGGGGYSDPDPEFRGIGRLLFGKDGYRWNKGARRN